MTWVRRAVVALSGVVALALVAGAAVPASAEFGSRSHAAPGGHAASGGHAALGDRAASQLAGSPLAAPQERVEEAEDEAEAARERLREAEEQAEASRRAAEEAEAQVAERLAQLDAAAEAYEDARAHHQRLADERDDADARIDAVVRQQDAQHEVFAEHVATLYKSPPPELSMLEWVLASEAPDALHRVELVGRVSARGAQRLDEGRELAERTVDEVRQQHVIVAGVDEAARELDAQREALSLEVGRARAAAEAAEADAVRAAEAASVAGEEAEEAEATLERARRAAAFVGDGEALPPVDGMVCPVGTPHGFSDSWHAPRPGGRQHLGVDIFAPRGTPIYAVEDGTVRASSNRLGGLVVYLTANDGDRYYYAHLDEVFVETGERVRAGDVIGANGDTGNARGTPPHLHWEVRPGGGDRVNPYPLARELCRPEHRGS